MHLEIQVKDGDETWVHTVLNQLADWLWSEVILFIMNALKNRASGFKGEITFISNGPRE